MGKNGSFYSVLTAGILAAALSLSGCKESPEAEIVAGKDAERFEQLLQETGTSAQQDADESGENGFREFRHKTKLCGSDRWVTVEVDAAVKEWAGNLPVYRVAPHIIGKEEAQKWAGVFFEGKTAYDKKIELSKAEIEDKILQLKQEMDEGSLQEEYGADPEMLKYAKEYYQEQLALYEELYETAPETVERKKTNWEFHPSAYYDVEFGLSANSEEEQRLDKTQTLKIEADIEGNTYQIWANNRQADDFMWQNVWFTTPNETYEWEHLSESEESVKKLVQDTLKGVWKRFIISSNDNVGIFSFSTAIRSIGLSHKANLIRPLLTSNSRMVILLSRQDE